LGTSADQPNDDGSDFFFTINLDREIGKTVLLMSCASVGTPRRKNQAIKRILQFIGVTSTDGLHAQSHQRGVENKPVNEV
jgi:hypothetical protein